MTIAAVTAAVMKVRRRTLQIIKGKGLPLMLFAKDLILRSIQKITGGKIIPLVTMFKETEENLKVQNHTSPEVSMTRLVRPEERADLGAEKLTIISVWVGGGIADQEVEKDKTLIIKGSVIRVGILT